MAEGPLPGLPDLMEVIVPVGAPDAAGEGVPMLRPFSASWIPLSAWLAIWRNTEAITISGETAADRRGGGNACSTGAGAEA
jgi:hypothetical protein